MTCFNKRFDDREPPRFRSDLFMKVVVKKMTFLEKL